MKKILLLMVGVLMISSVAMADHIGLYQDASGASCSITPGGHFNGNTACVVHKFISPAGATAVRFAVALPAGSSVFAFSTTYTPNGTVTTDLSVGYGSCQNGSVAVGCIVGNLNPGTGDVVPAQGFPTILVASCIFVEGPATGGRFYVGGTGDCGEVATAPSTWGQVKALYR